jgi:polysaccharide export outer membrane protein
VTSLVSRAGRLAALCVVVSAASSCALLPGPGPTRNELFAGSVQNQGDAFIVEVNARVTSVTSSAPVLGFPRRSSTPAHPIPR